MNHWPTYADYGDGTAYVISSDMADKVCDVSQALNSSLYIDDESTGLCAKQCEMGIVSLYHVFSSD
jgi:hypothetical protein